jgi:hypothetical protein
LPRALAKYSKLYPEAVRSLAEEEEKTMTLYDFPQTLHRSIRTTNAIESLFSNVRQRDFPDRCVHHGDELSDHRLGDDAGHSAAKSPGVKDRT